MDQFNEQTNKTIKRINLLTDAVSLNQKINEMKDNEMLHEILREIDETTEIVENMQKMLNRDLVLVRREYDDVMHSLRETQKEILDFLVKTKKQKLAEEEAALKTPLRENSTNIPANTNSNSHLKVPNSVLNPAEQPSTSKRVQLKFSDIVVTPNKALPMVNRQVFEMHISIEQFESIPKYMRGRTTTNELQHFLENILIPCFCEKYKLQLRPRSAVQHSKDYELWKVFHSQMSFVPGRKFVTSADLSRKMQKMVDKKTQNYIVMLRHLGILQEQRISQTICYIWAAT